MEADPAHPLEVAASGASAFDQIAERHRRDLLGYCYRMTGSLAEAEDAVQETLLRAWKGRQGFEGRASVLTWLRSIATRACLDALDQRPPRSLPAACDGPADPAAPMAPPIEAAAWIEPAPDGWLSIAAFLNPSLFRAFGLPASIQPD